MGDTDAYLPRHLMPELEDAIASARVVNLIGPRQAGKTTLVRDLFGQGHFVTLDDTAVLAAIDADPEGQLTSLTEELDGAPLIIDEAQRSTNLALAIKKTVDTNRRKGQFVLTGPSNVFTKKWMSQTRLPEGCERSNFGHCPPPKSTRLRSIA